MTAAEVERIAQGYARGESVHVIGVEIGRNSGSVDQVVARLVNEGRLVRRRARQGKGEGPAPLRSTPRPQASRRKCLGCGTVFASPDPPRINRLCINCGKRA